MHRYHPVIWDFAVVLSSLGAVKNKADGGDTQNCSLLRDLSQMPVNEDIKEN